MSSLWSKRKQHGKIQLHYTDSEEQELHQWHRLELHHFHSSFTSVKLQGQVFFLDLIQTDIYLTYCGNGKKILNLAPCRALYFLLCFSTFPSPSNNQSASKFAVQIKWANDNSTIRWSLHNLKVFQALNKSKQMIQVLLAQSVTLPVEVRRC